MTTAKSATAAWLALLVGLPYALVSVYWGAGGTWLLDTVGGALERLGRSGSAAAAFLISFVVLRKVIAMVLPLVAIRPVNSFPTRRVIRRLAWVEAWILTGYGLVYTVGGLLVQADVLKASPDADRHAMAWHTYLWDPWFLVWGVLVTVALLNSRDSRGSSGVNRRERRDRAGGGEPGPRPRRSQ